MHRNTVFFIIILTVLASLLVGINMGKRISGGEPIVTQLPIPSSQPKIIYTSPTPIATNSAQTVTYAFTDCGISFSYQNDFTLTESSQGAQLTRPIAKTSTTKEPETINLACSGQIPRPPLARDRIDTATVAGLTVNLYHDASAKDGTPLDAIIFTHPKNGLDVAILGFGEAFKKLVPTIRLLP